MNTKTTQLRGHCQACGRLQAVGGGLAKHGYTVEDRGFGGFFAGTCPGSQHPAIEDSRELLDRWCAQHEEAAAKKEAAAINPRTPASIEQPGSYRERGKPPVMVEWSLVPEWQQEQWMKTYVWTLGQQAKTLRAFVADMRALADKIHGQEKVKVEKKVAAVPIRSGDQRKMENGNVLTVRRVDGARVYFKDPKGFQGWIGTQAWRRMSEVVV